MATPVAPALLRANFNLALAPRELLTIPEGANPLSFLVGTLLTRFGLPVALAQSRRVCLIAVPGGFALRFSREALHLEEQVRTTFDIESHPIQYQHWIRQAFIPLNLLDRLLETCGVDPRAREQIEAENPLLANYRVHISKEPADRQLRPAHTISLSLAHLDPEQHTLLYRYDNPFAKPEEENPGLKLPLIEATDRGLQIWFKEGSSSDFIELIKKIFMSTSEGATLIKPFGTYDTLIRIERRLVPQFLQKMRIEELGEHGIQFFLGHLIALRKYHLYRPTIIPNKPLESLALSLRDLLPQEPGKKFYPLVAIHPILGLMIRLPKDPFSKRFADFLGCEHRLTPCVIAGVEYEEEIVVPSEKLAGFLKELDLEAMEQPLLDQMIALKASLIDIIGVRGKEGRIFNTLSRRLYALFGPEEAAWMKSFSPTATPERERALPRIDCSKKKITFYFPEILAQKSSPDHLIYKEAAQEEPVSRSRSWLPFLSASSTPSSQGNTLFLSYIAAVLGYPLESCDQDFEHDRSHYTFKIEVPTGEKGEKILELLERGFGLRELPEQNKIVFNRTFPGTGRESWWNELMYGFSSTLGIRFCPHGQVSPDGLKLKAPRIELPDPLPEYSQDDVLNIIVDVLTRNGVKEQTILTCRNGFKLIWNRVWKKESENQKIVLISLFHFIHELKNSERSSIEVKKNGILSVALSANKCLPGVQVRLAEETKRIAGQEANVKNLLLSTLEEWKNDLLADILGDIPQSVHAFAAAQVMWGEEFGLDVAAGKTDSNWEDYGLHHLNNQNREQFREACTNSDLLPDAVFRRTNEKEDDHGAVLDIAIYEDRVRILLNNKGLTPSEIDSAIETLFPTNAQTYATTISKQAIKLLLIDIGVLYR